MEIGKPKLSGKGKFTAPTPTQLTKKSKPDDFVTWTIGSQKFTGILMKWEEEGIALIKRSGPCMKMRSKQEVRIEVSE